MSEPRRIKESRNTARSRRVKQATDKSTDRLKDAGGLLKKQVNLPLPDNKLGKILSKRGSLVPPFLKNSWNELKLVVWPNRRETARLTVAVLLFALFIGLAVTGVDTVLEKLFKEVILP